MLSPEPQIPGDTRDCLEGSTKMLVKWKNVDKIIQVCFRNDKITIEHSLQSTPSA